MYLCTNFLIKISYFIQVFVVETGQDNYIQETSEHKKSKREWLKHAFKLIWKDLIAAYTNTTIIKWSIWWALATCGFYQVLNYTQLLWEEIIAETGQELYNGGVEAAYTIIGITRIHQFVHFCGDFIEHYNCAYSVL